MLCKQDQLDTTYKHTKIHVKTRKLPQYSSEHTEKIKKTDIDCL